MSWGRFSLLHTDGAGRRWVGGDARARELTLLPLSSDEGIKYNRKGLPQLRQGDAEGSAFPQWARQQQ